MRAHRGRCDAVLARAGLGDDPVLAEPAGDHALSERVVDLVGAGVEQILALQIEPLVGSEASRARQRRRTARVVRKQLVELGAERRVGAQ